MCSPFLEKEKFMERMKDYLRMAGWRIWAMLGSIVIAGLMVFGIFASVSDMNNKKQADDKMDQAEEMSDAVSQEVDTDAAPDLGYSDYLEEEEWDPEDEESFEGSQTLHEYNKYENGKKATKKDGNLCERIDFDKLSEMIDGDDIAGWLYIPGTEIDYVVMKGTAEEPSKYLWKDPYGDASNTGSLFMYGDLSDVDDHRVIYGHRLKDHDLYFGPLLEYRDESYAQDKQFLYFYDRNKVTRYRLYSVNEGMYDDMVYYYPYLRYAEDYQALIDDITLNASYTMEEEFHPGDRMLALSTCRGNGGGKPERLYLVFREDVIFEY